MTPENVTTTVTTAATVELDFAVRFGRFELAPRFTSTSRRLALFGASGSGKSLTLETIAGLVTPRTGVVRVGGTTFFDAARRVNLAPQARRVGYVPQQYLLFPHLSAVENVRYGLRDASNKQRVIELLELVGLLEHAAKRPRQLSGGQQQRVALARALASEPQVFLLDEPFAALDDVVRVSLRRYLADLLAHLGTPTVLVTHDLVEATMLADDIAVYRDGRVVQTGSGDDLYLRPASRYVADLTGMTNRFSGTVVGRDGAFMQVKWLEHLLDVADTRAAPGAAITLGIRPEHVLLVRRGHAVNTRCYPTTVTGVLTEGLNRLVTLQLGGGTLEMRLAARVCQAYGVRAGAEVWVRLEAEYLWPLPEEKAEEPEV
ncbi:ABC transporter ATP-binding protein [soil metagenome]